MSGKWGGQSKNSTHPSPAHVENLKSPTYPSRKRTFDSAYLKENPIFMAAGNPKVSVPQETANNSLVPPAETVTSEREKAKAFRDYRNKVRENISGDNPHSFNPVSATPPIQDSGSEPSKVQVLQLRNLLLNHLFWLRFLKRKP